MRIISSQFILDPQRLLQILAFKTSALLSFPDQILIILVVIIVFIEDESFCQKHNIFQACINVQLFELFTILLSSIEEHVKIVATYYATSNDLLLFMVTLLNQALGLGTVVQRITKQREQFIVYCRTSVIRSLINNKPSPTDQRDRDSREREWREGLEREGLERGIETRERQRD